MRCPLLILPRPHDNERRVEWLAATGQWLEAEREALQLGWDALKAGAILWRGYRRGLRAGHYRPKET